MSELTKTQDKNFVTVKDMLKREIGKFEAALPKVIPVNRFLGVVTGVLQNNPKLLDCNVKTLFSAILQCAQIGLEPDNALGLAHLVPYKGEIKLIISYKGYIALAHRSGAILDISARCIYENEKFTLEYGDNETLTHTPLPPTERGKKIIAAYSITKLTNGALHREFLWHDELMKLKKKAAYDKIWNEHEAEMCRKSAVRAGAKYICLAGDDNALLRATTIDSMGDVGLHQGIPIGDNVETIDISKDIAEKTDIKTDDLKKKIGNDEPDIETVDDKPGKAIGKDTNQTTGYDKDKASFSQKEKIKKLLIAIGTIEEEFLFAINEIIAPASIMVLDHLTPAEAIKTISRLEAKQKKAS